MEGEPSYNSVLLRFEQDGSSHDHNLATGRNDLKYIDEKNDYQDYYLEFDQDAEQNGKGVASYYNGYWIYEWEIPLRSGDNDDIYVDQFPSVPGLMVEVISFTNGNWPNNATGVEGPEFWGDLEII